MTERSQQLSWKLVVPLTAVFSVLVFTGLLHHEMWLDETHHWLLSRDSNSFRELSFNARYEGHPLLWNELLLVLAHFTTNVFAMQLLNFIVISTAVFLFLRFAPFKPLLKTGVVFSYFIFYEYAVLSRNYALSFLLLVISCIFFVRRRERFLLFSVALALLAQTHLFATVIAFGFLAFVSHEQFFTNEKYASRTFYAGTSLVLLSLLLAVWQSWPPADHFLYSYDPDPLLSFKRIGKALSVLWKGFFPLPDFRSDHPWNSNLFIAWSKNFSTMLAALAWLVPAILLWRNRKALLFFYGVTIVLVAFIYFSPLIVASRHCGFFLLLLIAALWICRSTDGKEREGKISALTRKLSLPVLILIFSMQIIGGIFLFAEDYKRPFSNGKAIVEWLKKTGNANDSIVVWDHTTGPPIAAYLRWNVNYLESGTFGSFCQWNTRPFVIDENELAVRMERYMRSRHEEAILLVASRPLKNFKLDHELLSTFEGAMVKAENYFVYRIRVKEVEKPMLSL